MLTLCSPLLTSNLAEVSGLVEKVYAHKQLEKRLLMRRSRIYTTLLISNTADMSSMVDH